MGHYQDSTFELELRIGLSHPCAICQITKGCLQQGTLNWNCVLDWVDSLEIEKQLWDITRKISIFELELCIGLGHPCLN